MDSDDEDRLCIVDDIEAADQTDDKIEAKSEEVIPKEEEHTTIPQRRQLKSRLPASLRNRIVRSNARSTSLITTELDVKVTRRSAGRHPAKLRSQTSGISAVKKEETAVDFEAAINELGHEENPNIVVKKEEDEVVVGVRLLSEPRNTCALNQSQATTTISGKNRVFTHPRLRSGDRLTKLIDPLDSVVLQNCKEKSSAKKNRSATGTGTSLNASRQRKGDENVPKKPQSKATLKLTSRLPAIKKNRNSSNEEDELHPKNRKKAASKVTSDQHTKVSCPNAGANEPSAKKQAEVDKRTKTPVAVASDEEDFFYTRKPRKFDENETTSDNGEDTESRLTRARRRKLTRSLLRGGNSFKRLRKSAMCPTGRRRMPRIHCDENKGVETFDSFLNFPLITVDTVEDLTCDANESMNLIYQDYITNVRGGGTDVNNFGKKVEERVKWLKKEVAKAEYNYKQAEREDFLGTDPFLDPVAYCRHPVVRRGDRVISMLSTSCDMHAAQYRPNSCALSELAGAMWRVKPFEGFRNESVLASSYVEGTTVNLTNRARSILPIRFCRGEGNKIYEVSDYLDQVSGDASRTALGRISEAHQSSRFCLLIAYAQRVCLHLIHILVFAENLHAKVKFEKILEEKIRTVHNSVTGARSRKPTGFVKDEQNYSMPASATTPNLISLHADLTSDYSDNCAYIEAAAILLEEYSGFRRRCRRQRRPTVAAVAAVVDTPSSIPIDDSGDDYGDKEIIVGSVLALFCRQFFVIKDKWSALINPVTRDAPRIRLHLRNRRGVECAPLINGTSHNFGNQRQQGTMNVITWVLAIILVVRDVSSTSLDITLPYRFRSMGGVSRMYHTRAEKPRSLKRQELENAESEYLFSHLGFGANSVFSPRFGFIVERPRLYEE
ncbi:hypothetical protein Y032_0147g2585 [Ancylostoma ceylanicum]|uniref:Uncharacterized protein n=1 Tax=Ancylostoma ceylanicum TaxID=53326 RepID=A0A016T2D8_9BILA|nr:hypothetical protein Y032_0147g2585 [Ancylostoma ceylanicum]